MVQNLVLSVNTDDVTGELPEIPAGSRTGARVGSGKGRVVTRAGARNTEYVPTSRLTLVTAALVALVSLSGCSRANSRATANPTYAPPNAVAYQQANYQTGDLPRANTAYADVYVQDQYYAPATAGYPTDTLGYETLSTGDQVAVVTYVHTYPEAIETFPRVYWAGRWYYNVQGSFVFWDPYWDTWAYYYGPPVPLVYTWNYHYPWVAYSYGVGYYGAGWYWGGVGYYGYHAYGRPPDYWRPSHNPNADPGGPTAGSRPTAHPNPPVDTTPGVVAAGNRDVQAPNLPGSAPAKPGRAPVAAAPGANNVTRNPTTSATPAAPTDVAAPAPSRAPSRATPTVATSPEVRSQPKPGRAPIDARRVEPSKPPRAPVASVSPSRARVPQVQVHANSPQSTRPTYAPPTTRATQPSRSPTRSVSVGTNHNPRPAPTATPSSSGPTYRTYTPPANPSRSSVPNYGSSSPSRSYSPSQSSSPSRSYSPSHSSPSRSYSPSHSSPSRSYSPSHSSPSRSYSPSHSSGGGGRSYSPSHSSGGGGGRSFSPSHSGGGGGRSFSPSHSGGGGRHR